MPDIMTAADSLREYLTGAVSDGATSSQETSLGGHRSSVELSCLAMFLDRTPGGTKIVFASGANGSGIGTLHAPGPDQLRWTPPGGSTGAAVTFSSAGTKVLEGVVPGQYLRVAGTPPFQPGAGAVVLLPNYNNVLAQSDAAGPGSTYRAVMLKNVSAGTLTQVKRWIGVLGTPRTTATAQLAGSGAGTVTVTGSLDDWPVRGWAQIRQSGGTLREVVYYDRRTGSSLSVPSTGRARLGTSASAGAASDVAHPVPGVAIAASVAGVVNSGVAMATIADETTTPAGVTWSLGITSADAVTFATMTTGQQAGLWVWREVPTGVRGAPAHTVRINGSFIY